ncbi:MAG: AAA-like domain-containing protein [Deltaproteobacteria bacterium]|nr:AAA-like domain-containing protein [Deltaproteobacteria bacterium]
MARQFNTAHVNRAEQHYTLPPLDRLPPTVEGLVHDGYYFVLHAPRQSGKTTTVLALADKLRADGRYAVVYCTVEAARATACVDEVVDVVIDVVRLATARQLSPAERPPALPVADREPARTRLYAYLAAWCTACPRPVVLFIDEIDCLQDEGLVSVLSQFRMGYAERPKGFPHSVCIFGMRDVRDYKIASGGQDRAASSSPFNVKRESITLATFSRADVAALYAQHTAETGQAFTAAAIDRVAELTGGQPHLVNALAHDVVAKQGWTGTVDVAQIDTAKDNLIVQWGTHFDSLMARLREDRVLRVLEPILAGSSIGGGDLEDDRYCRDLGLIDGPDGDIANAIYREVIPRCLAGRWQHKLRVTSGRWRGDDGRLDIDGLRAAFLAFWREHAEGFVQAEGYREVAVQLVFMGFLQRIVNGGGWVDREYAAGSRRMDILVRWPVPDDDGTVPRYPVRFERHLFELKVWHPKKGDPRDEGLAQVGAYLRRVPCESASLLIFDRRPETEAREWGDRMVVEEARPLVEGREVWVFRG